MPKKKIKRQRPAHKAIENTALLITKRIGSVYSLIIHSVFFALFFLLGFFGIDWNVLLLALTTIVSLEAIYLSLFIQMTVNKNTESLVEVEENIDEIQEDIDEIQEDIDDIQEDVDEIQEDVDDIAEEEKEAESHERQQILTLNQIQDELQQLARTIESLRKK